MIVLETLRCSRVKTYIASESGCLGSQIAFKSCCYVTQNPGNVAQNPLYIHCSEGVVRAVVT